MLFLAQADEGSPSWQNANWSSPPLWRERITRLWLAVASLPFPSFLTGEATARIAGYQFARMTRNVSVKETSKSWRRKVLDA